MSDHPYSDHVVHNVAKRIQKEVSRIYTGTRDNKGLLDDHEAQQLAHEVLQQANKRQHRPD